MFNPEYENLSSQDEVKDKDESGYSEKQTDRNVETGVFRKSNSKKIIFQNKAKK